MRGWWIAIFTLAAAAAAVGQTPTVTAQRPDPGAASRAKKPYTAEFKTTRVQTLANGSTITYESNEVMAQDAQGRTYSSVTTSQGWETQVARTSVHVTDPVAGTVTSWFTPGERVTVSSFNGTDAVRAACGARPMPRPEPDVRIKPKREDLGMQTFQGVDAHGWRTIESFPAGTMGNSDQIVKTYESWSATAPGMNGLVVHIESDDPQVGKTVRELVRFTPGDPDPALFQPSAEMAVVTDEVHHEVKCP